MYYIIQNCFTGRFWEARASEARFFADDNMNLLYNIYRVGASPVPLSVYEIV